MKRIITILGPTACGKTTLAARLALELDGEIISADSRQVYKDMNIGTGKDLADYETDGRHIRYYLIDIAEPGSKYNLFQYQRDFRKALDEVESRGKLPILCGGTGLYIEAVLKGYRLSYVPENKPLRASLDGKSLGELTEILSKLKSQNGSNMHNTTDVDTAQRAIRAIEIETYISRNPGNGSRETRKSDPIDSLIIGISIGRDERRAKITARLRQRLKEGMADEVRELLERGLAPDDLIYYGLEYKYVTEYVIGKRSYDDMFSSLEIAIHQFAKRQMTWFRGMERRGLKINWIDASMPMEEKINEIKRLWQ